MITNYTVTGMTCEHCVAHVTEEVSAIPDVEKVDVSLADGRMQVTSPRPVDFAAVQDAVAEAGNYSVAEA